MQKIVKNNTKVTNYFIILLQIINVANFFSLIFTGPPLLSHLPYFDSHDLRESCRLVLTRITRRSKNRESTYELRI